MQQLYLHGHGHLSYLIKENRPACGCLKKSLFGGSSPCECTAFMAKEFTAYELFSKPSTVEINKGPLASLAQVVDGLCNHLFSCTCFSLKQHVAVHHCHLLHYLENLLHGRACPDKTRNHAVTVHGVTQFAVLLPHDDLLFHSVYHETDIMLAAGLGEIVEGSLSGGINGRFDASMACNDNGLSIRVKLLKLFKDFEAIDIRKLEIYQRDITWIGTNIP